MEPDHTRQIWIISDTHFNHRRLVEYTGRPEDFTDQIITNWQRLVHPDDTVYHLGDIQLGRESTFRAIQAQLPGTKILVDPGNHDLHRPDWYLQRGFAAVFHGVRIGRRGDILLTHRPSIPIPEGIQWNIHGHFHNADDRRLLTDHTQTNIDYYHTQGERYALLEIESTLSPVLLASFCMAHNIEL